MDFSRLILFGVLVGLLLQWQNSEESGFLSYVKAALLGGSGVLVGGMFALTLHSLITHFSMGSFLPFAITFAAALVISNFFLHRTRRT